MFFQGKMGFALQDKHSTFLILKKKCKNTKKSIAHSRSFINSYWGVNAQTNNWDFSSRWILSPPASTWERFLWNSMNLRSWWIGGGKCHHYFFKRTSERKTVAPMKQCCSVAQLCLTLQPCGQHTRLPSPSPSSRSVLKLVSVESMMPSNHLSICCSLLLPSIFPSIRVFSIESTLCIRWQKYWSLSISPSNEYSRLISFRTD